MKGPNELGLATEVRGHGHLINQAEPSIADQCPQLMGSLPDEFESSVVLWIVRLESLSNDRPDVELVRIAEHSTCSSGGVRQ